MDKVYTTKESFITANFFYNQPSRLNNLIKTSQTYNLPIYIREGTFTTDVIMDNILYQIQKKVPTKSRIKVGTFLFSMVKADAIKYISKNKNIILPTEYPVNCFTENKQSLKKKWIATDINSAYWNIAYNLDVIQKNTYEKGLQYPKNYKTLRLAALSVLGQERQYKGMIGDELTGLNIILKSDNKMINIYKLIRYTCYQYMNDLRLLLKKDFICYRTDEIVYVATDKNIALVENYLHEKGLNCKHKEHAPTEITDLQKGVLNADFQ
jgi:hypothetical protein